MFKLVTYCYLKPIVRAGKKKHITHACINWSNCHLQLFTAGLQLARYRLSMMRPRLRGVNFTFVIFCWPRRGFPTQLLHLLQVRCQGIFSPHVPCGPCLICRHRAKDQWIGRPSEYGRLYGLVATLRQHLNSLSHSSISRAQRCLPWVIIRELMFPSPCLEMLSCK